jgi:hypothetical protein
MRNKDLFPQYPSYSHLVCVNFAARLLKNCTFDNRSQKCTRKRNQQLKLKLENIGFDKKKSWVVKTEKGVSIHTLTAKKYLKSHYPQKQNWKEVLNRWRKLSYPMNQIQGTFPFFCFQSPQAVYNIKDLIDMHRVKIKDSTYISYNFD